jgi:hypothetical protein
LPGSFGKRDEIGKIADGLRWMNDKGHWCVRDHGNRREIAHRIVRQLGVERRIDGMGADRANEQGLAVRRRLGHGVGTDGTACPAAIVDHDGRVQCLAEHLREGSRHNVGRPASRERNNDANLLSAQALGLTGCDPRQDARTRGDGSKPQ